MKLNPYLMFNGQCKAALKFYEQCLGAKIEAMMTYGESPMAEETPPESRNNIMHAHFTINNQDLMASDCSPEQYEQPKGFSVSLGIDDPVKAEHIFHALAENGTVQMPLQETFTSHTVLDLITPTMHSNVHSFWSLQEISAILILLT